MGKWSHLEKEGIPERPKEKSERTTRLYAEVDRLKQLPFAEVAHALQEGRAKKKRAAELESEANFDIEAADMALHRVMKAQGLQSVVFEGHRYTPEPEPYPVVTDAHTLRKWAIENMPDEVSLHSSRLKREVKAALDGESELPPGVDVFFSSSMSVTKSTKG